MANRYDDYNQLVDEHGASAINKAVSFYQKARKFAVSLLNGPLVAAATYALGADSKTVVALTAASVALSGGVYAVKNRRR